MSRFLYLPSSLIIYTWLWIGNRMDGIDRLFTSKTPTPFAISVAPCNHPEKKLAPAIPSKFPKAPCSNAKIVLSRLSLIVSLASLGVDRSIGSLVTRPSSLIVHQRDIIPGQVRIQAREMGQHCLLAYKVLGAGQDDGGIDF